MNAKTLILNMRAFKFITNTNRKVEISINNVDLKSYKNNTIEFADAIELGERENFMIQRNRKVIALRIEKLVHLH